MRQQKNTMQPVRDAAVLLALILLVLTVRPVGLDAVSELMPETEAASNLALPDDDLTAEAHPVQAGMPDLKMQN